jgi:hypothetical protein
MKVADVKILTIKPRRPQITRINNVTPPVAVSIDLSEKVRQKPQKRVKKQYLRHWFFFRYKKPGKADPDHLIRQYLNELYVLLFADQCSYPEAKMISEIQRIGIDAHEATTYFNYMVRLDIITMAAPGRYYKFDSLPF